MNKYEIINICEQPQLKDIVAKWFHSKWGIPLKSYKESIIDSLNSDVTVPAWYLCLDDNKIISGINTNNKRGITMKSTIILASTNEKSFSKEIVNLVTCPY